MKRILVFLLCNLLFFISFSQTRLAFEKKANHVYNEIKKQLYFVPSPDTIQLINITASNYLKNGWAQDGKTCAGCPSYYYKVTRSEIPYKAEDGKFYFYFYFYFFSNSFLPEGNYTGTYLNNIRFFSDGLNICDIPYLLLEPKKVIYGAWIRSINPEAAVTFKIANISVY